MAKSRAEIARDNLLEAVSKERAKSNPSKRVLKRLQGQLTRMGGRTSGGGSKATRTPAKNPDALRVADTPTSPDVRRVADRPTSPDVLRVADKPTYGDVLKVVARPAENPDAYNKLKPSKDKGYFPSSRKANPTSTVTAKPKANPRRPTVGGNMIGGTPPGGGTLSKKDVDEYSEAFASPDADKMYKLSEKNRRTDMNMLERAFDSIKVAGDRATADRKKRGLSNYDMNEDVFGSRLGGGIKNTMDNKEPSVRKRPAQRGFGVETRGN
jgi:hypothetical protein